VRYWWAGLGLTVLVLLYAAPIAAVFRQPVLPERTSPLPALSLPMVGLPMFAVPKVRPVPAVPPSTHHVTPKRVRESTSTTTPRHRTVKRVRVPVVTDRHSQLAPTTKQRREPADPFANVEVVDDGIGTPIALPATSGAAAVPESVPAPPAAPAAEPAPAEPVPATEPVDGSPTSPRSGVDLQWFSTQGDDAPADSSAAPAVSAEQTPVHETEATATETAAPATETTATATATTETAATTTEAGSTKAAETATADTASDVQAPVQVETTKAETTKASGGSQVHAPLVPASQASASSDTDEAAWTIAPESKAKHLFLVSATATQAVVAVDGIHASRALGKLVRIAIVGGDLEDTLTIDASLVTIAVPVSSTEAPETTLFRGRR
jgi:hypothetical protein